MVKQVEMQAIERPKAKLPGLNEINEMANRVVPNTNDFGDFFKDIDFFEYLNDFVKHLETETAIKSSSTSLNLHYVKNKLVFNRLSLNVDEATIRIQKSLFLITRFI